MDMTGSVILTFGTVCLVLALGSAYEGAWLFALVCAASCWTTVVVDRRRDRTGKLDIAGAVALAVFWFGVLGLAFLTSMAKRAH